MEKQTAIAPRRERRRHVRLVGQFGRFRGRLAVAARAGHRAHALDAGRHHGHVQHECPEFVPHGATEAPAKTLVDVYVQELRVRLRGRLAVRRAVVQNRVTLPGAFLLVPGKRRRGLEARGALEVHAAFHALDSRRRKTRLPKPKTVWVLGQDEVPERVPRNARLDDASRRAHLRFVRPVGGFDRDERVDVFRSRETHAVARPAQAQRHERARVVHQATTPRGVQQKADLRGGQNVFVQGEKSVAPRRRLGNIYGRGRYRSRRGRVRVFVLALPARTTERVAEGVQRCARLLLLLLLLRVVGVVRFPRVEVRRRGPPLDRRLDAHAERGGAGLVCAFSLRDAHNERQRAVARDGVAERLQARHHGSSGGVLFSVVLLLRRVFARAADRVVVAGGPVFLIRRQRRFGSRYREPVDERHGDGLNATAGTRVRGRRAVKSVLRRKRERATERLERGDGVGGRRRKGGD